MPSPGRPTRPATGGSRSSGRAGHSTRPASASCARTCSAGGTARRADVRRTRDREAVRRAFPAHGARRGAGAVGARGPAGHRRFVLVTGGSLGGMIAQEVALERPDAVGHLLPMAAPAATGPMAIAWNHIQLEAHRPLGDEGLEFARQLAMTTYRSEEDFDERFGRGREPDGRFSIPRTSTTRATSCSTGSMRTRTGARGGSWTATTSGGTGAGSRGPTGALAAAGTAVTGVGIPGDILYGADQVRALVDNARRRGRRRDVSRDPVEQGPRRVPHRVGPAHEIVGDALADGIARAGAGRDRAGERSPAPRNDSGRRVGHHSRMSWSIEAVREAPVTPEAVFARMRNPRHGATWGHNATWARADGPLVEGGTVDVRANTARSTVPGSGASCRTGARARRAAAGNDDHQRVRGRANAARRVADPPRVPIEGRWAGSRARDRPWAGVHEEARSRGRGGGPHGRAATDDRQRRDRCHRRGTALHGAERHLGSGRWED